jgi:hypothetical protein
MLCDGCDAEWHMHCLTPKMITIPHGDWFCNGCAPKRHPRSHQLADAAGGSPIFEAAASSGGDADAPEAVDGQAAAGSEPEDRPTADISVTKLNRDMEVRPKVNSTAAPIIEPEPCKWQVGQLVEGRAKNSGARAGYEQCRIKAIQTDGRYTVRFTDERFDQRDISDILALGSSLGARPRKPPAALR